MFAARRSIMASKRNSVNVSVTISSTVNNPSLTSLATSAGWNGTSIINLTVTINPTILVGNLNTGSSWPTGSIITIANYGKIYGTGGTGAVRAPSSPTPGQPGTHALTVSFPSCIINNYNGAIIGGGGGGGGAGGAGAIEPSPTGDGGAGGNGAGYQNNGSQTTGEYYGYDGGIGGSGGGLGQPGGAGTTGGANGGAVGGAAGKAIFKSGAGTYSLTNLGIIYGVTD